MTTFKKNKIRCKICGEILESKSIHDFVECPHCFTDGGVIVEGLGYYRRGWLPEYGDQRNVIEEIDEVITPEEYEEYHIRKTPEGHWII